MSYTSDLVNTMMNAMVEMKCSKGFQKLSNGLYEDCLGQVFTLDIKQVNKTDEDGMIISTLNIKMVPVAIAGNR